MRKHHQYLAPCLILLCFALSSCGTKKQPEPPRLNASPPVEEVRTEQPAQPLQLPVRYQMPGFVTAFDGQDADLAEITTEHQIRVGATIRSTGGPQPLWDVLKRLANLKGMTVSWASDVNQNTLVDVDISANDNFFEAVDNLLRQADYFHEMVGNTIIVRYKDTKIYRLGIPAMKGGYTTTVGGNFLAASDAASGSEGTVKITSDQNLFDVWDNVKLNLDTILEVWSIRRERETIAIDPDAIDDEVADVSRTFQGTIQATDMIQRSAQAYYTIDQSVGMISVTAPRPLLEKVDQYIENLKEELYRQVAIEAKIIEVYLQDNSKIGLDWSNVLKDFNISGTTFFGTAGTGGDGQVYPWIPAVGDDPSITRFVSKITLNPANFNVLLNALNEQGDAHVLANPKLTVLNGQPAMISVGKNVAYIRTVTREVDDNNRITFTAETDNVVDGIALGVMASIIDNRRVTLHLTPITTNLVGDTIQYRSFGDDGLVVGLPEIRVRQMSTMVDVEDGEMLIIGGLIDSVESSSGKFAPLVGRIPVVKYLFGVEEKRMERRELVILLTPTILNARAN
ncbi:type II and III secretion system protein [Desulfobulbus alkaliphilus]|uniref:type II and III secretion system protein n=1 Tax=Desulfobulbus alkaliphilus TaxID=869814 RepID=UPI001964B7F7|nr:type II and III secretion system protein [Desulfobulbus alkaliphilus]MBM9536603.1 type II and III secretion system protein [Desulfobulbus alkaliphilus]